MISKLNLFSSARPRASTGSGAQAPEASSENSAVTDLFVDTAQFLDGAVPVVGALKNHRTYKAELAKATDETGHINDSSRYLRASSGRDANILGSVITGIGLATLAVGSGGLLVVPGLAAVAVGTAFLGVSGVDHAAAKPNDR